MTSSKFSLKRSVKSYFEEISSFDLFYQLTYMSATSAAGVSRARTFQLARDLPCPPAHYFKSIHQVAENLRYNYPDAVRLIGEQAKSEETKTFLLRLADALRSGEPLPTFLAREAEVQGEHYANDYARGLESLKKWSDAYSAVTVSAALIVIINMVSTMIYNIGLGAMMLMAMVAIGASFGVAWVLFRSAPQEVVSVSLAKGSIEQRRSWQLFLLLAPLAIAVTGGLSFVGIDIPYVMIAGGLLLLPIGILSGQADSKTAQKDTEISAFLRSLGGTATSRGTTLRDALGSMKIDSFPSLQRDIRKLDLRLKAFVKPSLCWETFGFESGSELVREAMGIFYQATNLGGDPDRTGKLASMFAMKTAMLRAQRRGVAATFTWLVIVMHAVLTLLMVFLLGILQEFALRLNAAIGSLGQGAQALDTFGLASMFSFSTPQVQFLNTLTVSMVMLLAATSAFAIVASEGSHMLKCTLYFSILLLVSAFGFLTVPSLVRMVM
jgi:archaeal flagellar protein FlaJ